MNERENIGASEQFLIGYRKRVANSDFARTILINRDKASLDIFWLRDESLEESDNLPDADVLTLEIVEDLEAALEQFREIAGDLGLKESQS